MPSVQPPSKVLVTGANGFIAAWIIKNLLEEGYAVRGTVRSLSKAAELKTIFAKYGDKLEFVEVEDIGKEGAFDEAVKGVDAIEHTATPFTVQFTDPQELIGPAINGTVAILKSAAKPGSTVKRVVVTSSTVAKWQLDKPAPADLSEEHWNDVAIAHVEANGKDSNGILVYAAGKALAEKAAHAFVAEHGASLPWDLTVINPPFVFGPPLTNTKDVNSLNFSNFLLYNHIVSEGTMGKSHEALATESENWIDVRDVARAHLLALRKEAAGGERIITAGPPFVWQDFIDTANSLNPSPIPSHTLPKGNPGAGRDAVHKWNITSTKATDILGLTFRSEEELIRDTLAYFEAQGL